MVFGSNLGVWKGSDRMLTRYLERHEETIDRMFEAHPMLSFTGGLAAMGAAVLGAVSAVTILAALPIYLLASIF